MTEMLVLIFLFLVFAYLGIANYFLIMLLALAVCMVAIGFIIFLYELFFAATRLSRKFYITIGTIICFAGLLIASLNLMFEVLPQNYQFPNVAIGILALISLMGFCLTLAVFFARRSVDIVFSLTKRSNL